MRIVFLIFFTVFFFINSGYSQTESESTGFNEDFAKTLPPLQALIDSALIHSPAMKMADNEILISKYNLKEVNRNLLEKVYISGNARYGSELYFYDSEELINDLITNDDKIRYYAGINVRIPFSDIFDRRIPKQKAKIGIEQSEFRKEELEKSLRQLVISQYYSLLSQQNLLKLRMEQQSASSILYEQAKLDYELNKISLSEYMSANGAFFSAKGNYEVQKNEFNKSYLLLEEMIGIKLKK